MPGVSAVERPRLDFAAINLVAMHDPTPESGWQPSRPPSRTAARPSMERLLELLRTDPSVEVRQAAADDVARFALLGELGDLDADQTQRVRQALVDAVHDPNEEARVRSAALGAAGYFSDGDMAQLLAPASRIPIWSSAPYAAWAAAPTALDRTASDRPRQRQPAPAARTVRALGEIEDERAVEALSGLTDDPDEAVELAVIQALGDIGGDEARDTLLYLLEDSNQVIREAAEEAIRQLEFYEDPLGL